MTWDRYQNDRLEILYKQAWKFWKNKHVTYVSSWSFINKRHFTYSFVLYFVIQGFRATFKSKLKIIKLNLNPNRIKKRSKNVFASKIFNLLIYIKTFSLHFEKSLLFFQLQVAFCYYNANLRSRLLMIQRLLQKPRVIFFYFCLITECKNTYKQMIP